MADTSSQIRIIFDGTARGVVGAAAEARAAIASVNDESGKLSKSADAIQGAALGATKGILAIGSAAGGLQTVGAAAVSIGTMAGIAAALPAVMLAGAGAMATFKLATQGVGDAFSAGLAGDAEAFAEAAAKLAPNAREAAEAVRDLGPGFRELQQDVQNVAFADFAEDVQRLGGTYMPILEGRFLAAADSLNSMGKYAADALMKPATVNNVSDALRGTNMLLSNSTNLVGDMLEGFLALGGEGSKYMADLGNSIAGGAAAWKDWANEAAAAGKVDDWIEGAIDEFTTWGRVLQNVGSIGATVFDGLSTGGYDLAGSLEETTAALDEFLDSAEGQEILKELGETLQVTGDVAREILMTALQELGPVIVELAPAARAVATAIGDFLVNALQTVGPILQGVAGFLGDHSQLLGDLVPIVLAAVAAYRGMQIVSQVAGWVSGATTALGLFGAGADDAGKKADGLIAKSGLIKGALGALGVGVAVTALAELQRSTEGADGKISELTDTLQDLSGAIQQVLSGDVGGIFDDITSEFDQMKRHIEGNNSFEFEADTGPAQAQVVQFMGALRGTVGEINIDGRTTDASQALANIMQAINQGRAEVLIDGKATPVQDALQIVVDQINASGGMVEINGEYVKAGDALRMFLETANRPGQARVPVEGELSPIEASLQTLYGRISEDAPKVKIGADEVPVTEALNRVITAINTGQGEVVINGQTMSAYGALRAVEAVINQTQGDVTIGGDPVPAGKALTDTLAAIRAGEAEVSIGGNKVPVEQAIAAIIALANGTPAVMPLNGDPAQGMGEVEKLRGAGSAPATMPLLGDPSQGLGQVAVLDGAQTTPQTKPLNGDNAQGMGEVAALDGAQTTPQTKPLNGDNAQGMGEVQKLDAAGKATVVKPIQSRDENSGSVFAAIQRTFSGVITQVVRVVQEFFGGANGGAVDDFPGMASGGAPMIYKGRPRGAIHGPGTGTSDEAGLFRLANGEHVLTAAEVRALGGQANVYQLRAMIRAGEIPGFAGGGAVGAGGTSTVTAPSYSPSLVARVYLDGREVSGVIRTEIENADRASARAYRVRAGVA
ncbi:hypothetical protein [Pseudonocardia pini]|uniref:hypothetical protein n=1 Tax=Pseudonocardia pini TaxID=2758030 RepID=UPI0015F0D4A9|nr:hypothetical protein [Pseudonocardia pini]